MELLRLLEQVGAGAQFERSFKLLDGTLLPNRVLLAVEKSSIAGDSEAQIIKVCEGLGMPEAGLRVFRDHLEEADVVGFGLEEEETTCVVKAYLEFRRRYTEAMREPRDTTYSYVSHVGVKWDAADRARHAVAQYSCFPALTAQDVLERVAAAGDPAGDSGPIAVVGDIVGLAVRKANPDRFLYLEVSEAHTPRASFDVNVYPADLAMSDVHDHLAEIFRRFAIPDARFRELYETMREATLGHLAGGTDRRGRRFLTVYFEE